MKKTTAGTPPAQAIKDAIAKIREKWVNAPEIHIVEKAEDLPEEIKDQAPREAKGRMGKVLGVYHRGKVYLVAEHIADAEEAQRVLLHEVRGHLGMRAVFGKDFDAFLDEFYAVIPKTDLYLIAKRYKLDLNDLEGRRTAVDEYLAKLAENPQRKPSLWQRVVSWVRGALRKMGFIVTYTEAEIRELVVSKAFSRADRFLAGGERRSKPRGEQTTFSMRTSMKAKALSEGMPMFRVKDIPTSKAVADFIDEAPKVNAKGGYNSKALYQFKQREHKQLAVNGARRFISRYRSYTKSNPIIGKHGHKIYFQPDPKSILRLGQEKAYIEYALHSVTSTIDPANKNIRAFDSSKYDNLDNIDRIIKKADGYWEDGNKVYYYMAVRDGKRPYGTLVLEMSKTKDGLAVEDESLRYVTHLPSQKESQIKKMREKDNEDNSASEVNPAASDFPRGASAGATSPGSLNIIGSTEEEVKPPEDEGGKPRFRVADGTIDPSSLFEDVEERRKAAKGIVGKSLKDRLTEAATRMWHSWSRHFPNLTPAQGNLINHLRLFEEIPNSSKAQAADLVADIIGDMNEAELDVFTMNLVLPDLIKDIDKGILREGEKGLPFGYQDKEQIEQDLGHYEEESRKSDRIMSALAKRKSIMTRQKRELVDHGLLDKAVLDEDAYYHHQVLEVLAAKDRIGTGTSSGDVRLHTKGWQRGHKGTSCRQIREV